MRAMEEFSFTGNISQPNVAIQSAPLKLSSSMILVLAQRNKPCLGKYQSTKPEIQENAPGFIGDLRTEVQILFNILSKPFLLLKTAAGKIFNKYSLKISFGGKKPLAGWFLCMLMPGTRNANIK
ncbi:unnamed protein product [Coccothraustes coccothraustes]